MTDSTSTAVGDFFYCPECGEQLIEGVYHVCNNVKMKWTWADKEPLYISKTDIERAIDALNRIADALDRMIK